MDTISVSLISDCCYDKLYIEQWTIGTQTYDVLYCKACNNGLYVKSPSCQCTTYPHSAYGYEMCSCAYLRWRIAELNITDRDFPVY